MMRFCHGNGRFIDAHGAMPEVGYEAVGEPLYPDIGCNRLRCATCGEPLRDLVAVTPAQGLSREQALLLYAEAATGIGAASLTLLRDDAAARLYLCACGGHFVCTRSRYLAAGGEDDYTGPAPSDWACGGHDALVIPGTVDGEPIPPGLTLAGSSDAAWDALAIGAINGERAVARPDYLVNPPGAWCQRMAWLLPPGESEALGAALGRMVLGADEANMKGALGLFHDAPLTAGAEAVEALALRADPTALASKVNASETASDVVQLVLAARLARGGEDALAATIRAARRAVGWPSRRRLVLIDALTARDFEGVLAEVEAFGDERMVVRQLMLGAYRAAGDDGVLRLAARMKALARPGLAHLVSLARTNLPAASADKVAAAVG